MRQRKLWQRSARRLNLRGALFLSAVTLLAACGEVEEQLPGGLLLLGLDGNTAAIVNSKGDIVMHPNIVSIRCDGRFVYGERKLAVTNTDGSPSFTEGLGHFVLDSSSKQAVIGLDEDKLKARLASYGMIFEDPAPVQSTEFMLSKDGC